ncbi:MAG: TetR/AcrR family transcriptional regulator [Myxococcota bacterium]|jgi:TetR/AcrR family fatty acid metabolism transcriptional regulator
MSTIRIDLDVNASASATLDGGAARVQKSMPTPTKAKVSTASRATPAAEAESLDGTADRAPGKDERRKQILQAAVEVFAERGYHGCRISDVADRAGVAYGLVYHYFGNKESLLAQIFKSNWNVFAKALEELAEQETSTVERVRQVVRFLMNAFEFNPLIVKVLVLEFGRSSRLGDTLDSPEVARVFAAMERMLREGRDRGELAPSLDPRALTVVFLGALEAALASFVIPTGSEEHSEGAETFEAMQRTLMTLVDSAFPGERGTTPDEKQRASSKPKARPKRR